MWEATAIIYVMLWGQAGGKTNKHTNKNTPLYTLLTPRALHFYYNLLKTPLYKQSPFPNTLILKQPLVSS